MHSSDRSRRLHWLGALALAWATSALIVVREGGEPLVQLLVFTAWIWYGWRCAPLGIRAATRRALACALILAVPLQGIAAVERQAHGPAHFHVGESWHFHADTRHHHHAVAADAVMVDQQDEREAACVIGDIRSGVLDAAMISRRLVARPLREDRIRERPLAVSAPHFLATPERPPRA